MEAESPLIENREEDTDRKVMSIKYQVVKTSSR